MKAVYEKTEQASRRTVSCSSVGFYSSTDIFAETKGTGNCSKHTFKRGGRGYDSRKILQP